MENKFTTLILLLRFRPTEESRDVRKPRSYFHDIGRGELEICHFRSYSVVIQLPDYHHEIHRKNCHPCFEWNRIAILTADMDFSNHSQGSCFLPREVELNMATSSYFPRLFCLHCETCDSSTQPWRLGPTRPTMTTFLQLNNFQSKRKEVNGSRDANLETLK